MCLWQKRYEFFWIFYIITVLINAWNELFHRPIFFRPWDQTILFRRFLVDWNQIRPQNCSITSGFLNFLTVYRITPDIAKIIVFALLGWDSSKIWRDGAILRSDLSSAHQKTSEKYSLVPGSGILSYFVGLCYQRLILSRNNYIRGN